MRILLLALLLSACGDDTTTGQTADTGDTSTTVGTEETGTTDTESEPVDLDGDGVRSDWDCDDEDPDNFPGNLEFCDGADNDCNGAIDDDPYDVGTWYQDADLDGYGSEISIEACEISPGFADNDEDCNDLDAATYPGAPEDCDGADQDCDDYVDEDVSGEEFTWYADGDGDGYGTPYYTEEACTQPSDHVANSDDCDDLDAAIYPGVEEVCDGADNDCDGDTDEGSPTGSTTWYIDYDGDGYGSTSFTSTACEAPEGYVNDTSDCNDSSVDVHPGATEVCNEKDDDCDSSVDEDAELDLGTYYADDDGDGYGDADDTSEACTLPDGHVSNDDDCDDGDEDTWPGAPESCDSADQDCDGDIDEDASDGDTYWIDLDGDGYGNAILSTSECDQPSGYVDNSDDCNDLQPDAWPGNTEVCDGIDNDCDDDADEAGASDATTWYADTDGDGYGDGDSSDVQCEAPSSHVASAGDCDDTQATINPTALEQCDSVDNDCDGDTDEDGAIDVIAWYADVDGDGYGEASVYEEHCDAPTSYVADATDCDDGEVLANPGETETCNDGIDNDCDGTASGCQITGSVAVSKADAEWYGETSSNYLGASVSFVGDLDADGYDDMMMGAYCNHDNGSCSGAVYVVYGDSSIESVYAVSSEIQLYGESSDDQAGRDIHGGFDVNDDGYDDTLIVAPYSDDYTTDAGSIYLRYGPEAGTEDLYNSDAEYYGETSYQYPRAAVFPGDVDGDGYADILFGAGNNDDGGSESGSAYLFYGPPSAHDQYGYNADTQFVGEDSSDYAGESLGYAGDLDEDGHDEVLIGAHYQDEGGNYAGAAYLFFGDVSGGNQDLSSADAKYVGEYDYDYAGCSLASGDLDDDGQRDVVIGADGSDDGGSDSGVVYVVDGSRTGTIDLGGAEAKIVGERSSTYVGRSIDVADIDNDGIDDLVIGAYGVSSYAGAVYLVYGPITGLVDLAVADAEIRGNSSYDYLGFSVSAGGDVDGDGVGDILMGAFNDDDNGGESGTVSLFFGTGL